MDILALVPFILLGIALGWALWLVFKRNLANEGLFKMLSYFLGVIVIFFIAGWLVVTYLPQWATNLLSDAQADANVDQFGQITKQIWQEAMGDSKPVTVNPTQPGGTTPTPGVSPVTPGATSSGAALGQINHQVVSGDTLYSLSRKYGVSVAAIQAANNLGISTNIRIGQTLIIPKP